MDYRGDVLWCDEERFVEGLQSLLFVTQCTVVKPELVERDLVRGNE